MAFTFCSVNQACLRRDSDKRNVMWPQMKDRREFQHMLEVCRRRRLYLPGDIRKLVLLVCFVVIAHPLSFSELFGHLFLLSQSLAFLIVFPLLLFIKYSSYLHTRSYT